MNFDDLDVSLPSYSSEITGYTSAGHPFTQRSFNWGTCTLSGDSASVGCILKDTSLSFAIENDLSMCIVYSTDVSSLENKLCKNETGRNGPTYTAATYLQWQY